MPIPARLGDFIIGEYLGRGGMGVVYEAQQCSLDRRVAIKLISPEHARDPRSLARFRREARAAARVTDRHLVQVFAVGSDDGWHYLAQEIVEGGRHLGHLIDEAPDAFDADWSRRVVVLIRDAARALDRVHRAGVLHRDLKPSNLLITPDDEMRVADFGLALLDGALAVTSTGHLPGTPLYMSPEQVRGDRSAIAPASDVFSLGACLYEALTGRAAFRGDSQAVIALRIATGDVEDPRRLRADLDADLAAIVIRALESERSRRYKSMGEFADELDRWLIGEPVRARVPGVLRRTRKWLTKRPKLRAAVAAIPAIGLGVGAVLAIQSWSTPPLQERLRSLDPALALEAVAEVEARMGEDAARHWDGVEELAAVVRERVPWDGTDPGYVQPTAPTTYGIWKELNPGPAAEDFATESPVAYAALVSLAQRSLEYESAEFANDIARHHRPLLAGADPGVADLDELAQQVRREVSAMGPRQVLAEQDAIPGYYRYVHDARPLTNELVARPWVRLSGVRLVGLTEHATGLDLAGATFEGSDLSFSDLTGMRLGRCRFDGALMVDTDFPGADLRQSAFDASRAYGVNFSGARMAGACMNGALLWRCNFWGTDLTGAILVGATFEETSQMAGIKLVNCTAYRARFVGGRMGHADPATVRADARDGFFLRAEFRDLLAQHVDFRRADLRETVWARVDLRHATLAGADLTDASFEDVDLRGADLSEVNGWTASLAAGATVDGETRLPE